MATPSEVTRTRGGQSNWRQLYLLLWKDCLLQKKKIVRTIAIVLLPIYFTSSLVSMRKQSENHFMRNLTAYDSFFVTTNLTHDLRDPPKKVIFVYAPNTTLVARIVDRTANLMGLEIPPNLGFATEIALEEYVSTNEDIFGAIVFVKSKWDDLPKTLSYKIRLRSDRRSSTTGERVKIKWNTNATFSDRDVMEPRNDTGPVYIEEGFLAIQKAVDLSLIAEVNQSFDPTTMNVTTQLKQYPFPPYYKDAMIDIFQFALPILILLSFIVIVPTICQEIVLEKENKFKELMKLMGMRMWLYWSSWIVKYMLFMLISVIAMTIIFHAPFTSNGPVIAHTSATVTFVFLLLYSLSLVTFCFAIATLASKATYGSAMGGLLFFFSFVPSMLLLRVYIDMSLTQKLGASLVFNIAMAFGCFEIYHHEALGIGVHWSTMWSSDDGHTMGYILLMLFVDTIIFSMLTWYFDAIISGDFGISQPFYFPFRKEYWLGRKGYETEPSNKDFMTLIPETRRPFFETQVQDAKAGIHIRGLTKNFGSNAMPAVNNLNIDIYEGNITALVGHNGAGKTTTILMLTGFLPPSKGSAFINGLDITQDMDKIRQNLGLCPQHDILFDTLTVREHLVFFAMLRGSSFERASLQMIEMLRVLHMKENINAQAIKLSGGERRKLSVGIALISGSKIVILDEPTSGMDPESRRQTWDILQSQRKDRTMILSTHYMDEADILGDRIAIMSNGEIDCYGTPMFLKNKYGVGYHLTIVKTPSCDVDQLRDEIMSQIFMARIERNEAEEVTFVLPSNQVSKFEKLFETLETDGKTLGIDSFGVSVTKMEEVFLRVTESSTPAGGPARRSIAPEVEIQRNKSSHVDVLYRIKTSRKLQNLQLYAMLYKRLFHSIRNYALTLSQILIPVLLTVLACLTLLNPIRDYNFPEITLDLTHFKRPITPYDVLNPDAQALASCYVTSVSRHSMPLLIKSKSNARTMDAFLLEIGEGHKEKYNRNYLIGATIKSFGGNWSITGFFNNQSYHAIAIALSYLGNALMQCFGDKEYQIETINHPLTRNSSDQIKDIADQKTISGFGFSFCLSFGLAFLSPTFLVFLIKERKSGVKHSQLVSGVTLYNFWLATFIWDCFNYLVLCVLIIIVILGFQTEGYWQHTWIILIGLMLYGISMLAIAYVMSFLFEEESVGFLWLFVICFITGPFSDIFRIMLRSSWQTVEWFFYVLFPNYCFSALLQNIYKNYNRHQGCIEMRQGLELSEFCAYVKRIGQPNPCCEGNCGKDCIEMVDNYLSWTLPGVGRPLVGLFMVLQGIIFFHILYIIETYDIVGYLLRMRTSYLMSLAMLDMQANRYGETNEDWDVIVEQHRIHSHPIQELVKTDAVVTQELTKLYGDFVAVEKLSFGVPQKECFGLLGVNGAGKTTVFKMLTGEILPSSGSAYIAGMSVQSDLAHVRHKIGYCAQFDSIIDQLTVRETLWMYACAHGIPIEVRQEVINRLIENLTLKPYTNEQAGKLSGGNKRKLCLAVALMGNPTVVFLDEPTTGVDPEARRHVWNTLADARNAGTTIMLTSHSMEECEAICTRMGILVNGRFLCLGSLQHLRDRFSEGYTLIIKLKRSADAEKLKELEEHIQKLKTFISQTFSKSVLKDQHENLLYFQIETPIIKWSHIFGIMEKAKITYQIEDYTVGQTTLEQIFVRFARLQGQRVRLEVPEKTCFGLC